MVYRSSFNAYAYGGVSFANTSYDSSCAYANIGSRLANNERTQEFGSWPTAQERVSHAAPRGMSLASSGQGRKGETHSVG